MRTITCLESRHKPSKCSRLLMMFNIKKTLSTLCQKRIAGRRNKNNQEILRGVFSSADLYLQARKQKFHGKFDGLMNDLYKPEQSSYV